MRRVAAAATTVVAAAAASALSPTPPPAAFSPNFLAPFPPPPPTAKTLRGRRSFGATTTTTTTTTTIGGVGGGGGGAEEEEEGRGGGSSSLEAFPLRAPAEAGARRRRSGRRRRRAAIVLRSSSTGTAADEGEEEDDEEKNDDLRRPAGRRRRRRRSPRRSVRDDDDVVVVPPFPSSSRRTDASSSSPPPPPPRNGTSPSSSSSSSSSSPPPAVSKKESKKKKKEPAINGVGSYTPNPHRDDDWTSQTLSIALPALVGMIADPLLSLMDTAFVGRLGSVELAALGACTSIFHLAFNAFRATTTATTSLVATALARGRGGGDEDKEEEAREVVGTSLRLGATVGFLVSFVLLRFGDFALSAMGVAPASELHPAGKSYLSVRSIAAPAVLLITVAEGAFRGYGDTKIPLAASLVAAGINLALDPLLMFGRVGWGVKGAAAATALSQLGAAGVYGWFLRRRRMLPVRSEKKKKGGVVASKLGAPNKLEIVSAILKANLAMTAKQGSLLLGWAYATSRATRLGRDHVAAHQVALSLWLVLALVMDGAAVAGQVLMARACGSSRRDEDFPDGDDGVGGRDKVRSLTKYMLKFAFLQGTVCTLLIHALGKPLASLFTTSPAVRSNLFGLMPRVARQQLLVSFTLVTEALAVGGSKFGLLAFGTSVSALWSVAEMRGANGIDEIWSRGIASLFVGRLFAASLGVLDMNGAFEAVATRAERRWRRSGRRRRQRPSTNEL